MSKSRPPWQKLFDSVRVVRNGGRVYVDPPTDAELDALEAEVGSPLPASYRAWMRRFGSGEVIGWVRLDPVVPRRGRERDGVISHTAACRAAFGEGGGLLSTLVYFGSSGGGDSYAWDPAAVTRKKPREYRFYQIPHGDEDAPEPAGDSFWRFLEWAKADMDSWERDEEYEAEPGLSFGPSFLRHKKKPMKREVAAWLKWSAGTIHRLALALRADPRPEEFAVLADALTDAGCANADLLASCRKEAFDEDRAWALKVLLG